MIVSPTEPPRLREVASKVSMFPERYGCDIAMAGRNGEWCGIQRKEIKDLCASLDDGRLGEQIAKMQSLDGIAMIVLEGAVEWSADGRLMGVRTNVGRDRFDSALWTCQEAGVWLTATGDLDETIRVVQHFERWVQKDRRKGLPTRGPANGVWGRASGQREFQVHLLTGMPGVGDELAGRMIDAVGFPWTWRVTRDELLAVDGLGKKKVDAMLAVIE